MPLPAAASPVALNSATVFTLFLDLYQEVHNWAVWVDGKEISLPQWRTVALPPHPPAHPDGGTLYARFRADFNDPVPNMDDSEVLLGIAGAVGAQCARAVLWIFVDGAQAQPIGGGGGNPITVDTAARTPTYGSSKV